MWEKRDIMSTLINVKIGIIDDDPMFFKLMKKMLEPEGVILSYYENGALALKDLGNHSFNIVLLDLHMPELNGGEFMIKLSELKMINQFEIILVTADNLSENEKYNYYSLGINEVLHKPVHKKELLNAIQACLSYLSESVN